MSRGSTGEQPLKRYYDGLEESLDMNESGTCQRISDSKYCLGNKYGEYHQHEGSVSRLRDDGSCHCPLSYCLLGLLKMSFRVDQLLTSV